MEVKCLECGKKVPQTPGKRKKEYCGPTCRTKFWKKKRDAGKEKKSRGRPKRVAVVENKPVSRPETEKAVQPTQVIEGPIKEVLKQASEENAKLGIEAMIAVIKAEKIPSHRDTSNGRKSWAFDQKKRIQELENQLK
jgi:hypothetical protein